MWFLLSVIGYFFLAIAFVMDKLILTKSVGKPIVYTFYSTIFLLPVFLLVPLGFVGIPHGIDLVLAIFSGTCFGLGLWTLFIAVKSGEASHIDPFNGAMITLATYAGSSFFLGETLKSVQIAGVTVLVFACLLLSFEKSQKHHGFHVGFLWAIISGVCFAASLVASKYLYGRYSFADTIVWTRASSSFFAVLLLFTKTIRRSLFGAKRIAAKTYGRRHAFGIVVTAKILSVVAVLILNYAISIGSVTLVNALGGLQYVCMFIIIYICTKFSPKIFKEYFTKRELTIEIIAIALVALGSGFFVM